MTYSEANRLRFQARGWRRLYALAWLLVCHRMRWVWLNIARTAAAGMCIRLAARLIGWQRVKRLWRTYV